ncbi:MAG: DUF6113 family protein [Jatrophihabitans sp.]
MTQRAITALAVALLIACAALSGLLEAMLVPVRAGTVIVPVSVVLAVLTNVGLPVLAWWAARATVAAVLPFAAWVVVVLLLSQSRPEGDVLLPGGKTGLTYVSYGLLLAGFISGIATIARLSSRSAARSRAADRTSRAAGE